MTIISKELERLRKIIDKYLKEIINIKGENQKEIFDAMEYSLFTGGKRLRPIFAIKVYEIFNPNIENILPYAAAIEMIHTYSLIHDDLPSMDNDDYRRGKLTNHRVFGEAMAILAGDGLLNLAFETMLKDALKEDEGIGYQQKVEVMYEIAKCAGVEGMIGGQVVDLFSNEGEMTRDKLLFMYQAKTAALFQASVLSGAILGGASPREVKILREYAQVLGLSYQLQDDLLDIEEDESINKFTYLSFYDKDKAEEDIERLCKESFDLLDKLDGRDTQFLKELTELLVNRKK